MTDPEKEQPLDLPTGIAPERGDNTGWGDILSVDEQGGQVISHDEERVYTESDPKRPGIVPHKPPKLIG